MSAREKISQKVSRELLQMIESGQFPVGSKLPTELELADRFGVSRVPIREALSILRAMGMVSSRQGGGTYVEDVSSHKIYSFAIQHSDEESIKALFEMRKIFEPEAAYLAAIRRTVLDLEQLQNALDRIEEAIALNDTVNIGVADFDFHRLIVRATANPIMISTMESLAPLYEKSLAITLAPNMGLERKRKIMYKEHQDIFSAIEAEEPELAKVQCLIHLKNAEKKLLLFYQDQIQFSQEEGGSC
ncbi:FadR/GntR family transcriptional regulator [Brevibacillus porteri]|uniref:FadR/GntR family transcriptional regulator n=1 Tax=Brevibacillus porteri TaxID=2126350 RepID=UPI003625E662